MNSVANAVYDENSAVTVSEKTMETLQLSRGDTVLIKEKNGRDTVLVVLSRNNLEDGYAYINRVVRDNLRVREGDVITMRSYLNIQYAKRITVQPTANNLEGFTSSLFDVYLTIYFRNAYRPIRGGDRFTVGGNKREVEFKVVEIDPAEYGVVANDTVIHCR
ncbi:unnamed protein product [Penicillium crustosum]